MQCPVCTTTQLVMSERSGIEIDYCPQCRGVWLDRGELDKIIDRAAPAATAPAARASSPQPHAQAYPQQVQHHGQAQTGYYYKKKKREGFLGELFDFD
ncbi:MAG: zf-TFIIB domain-containing protein [Pseudomonadota bacterium]